MVTLFVMAIAAMAYFAKVTGMGEAQIRGKTIPVIRYIDLGLKLCYAVGIETDFYCISVCIYKYINESLYIHTLCVCFM